MVLFLVAYAIQGEEGKTLRLVYVVEITGFKQSMTFTLRIFGMEVLV